MAACKKCNKTRGNTQYHDWLHHPYYRRRVSKALSEEGRMRNHRLLATLAAEKVLETLKGVGEVCNYTEEDWKSAQLLLRKDNP